jgi:hypothetical protein
VLVDERRFHAHLAVEQIPDHDFVLRYTAAGDGVQAAAWTSGEAEKRVLYGIAGSACPD